MKPQMAVVASSGIGGGLGVATQEPCLSTSVALTPTTVKSITQLLESDECLKTFLHYEQTGQVDVPQQKVHPQPASKKVPTSTVGTRRGNTYLNLDSKTWGGGTTTVLTSADIKEEEENSNGLPMQVITTTTTTALPESIVQTNLKRSSSMQTRSRTSNQNNMNTMERQHQSQQQAPSKKKKGNTGGGRRSTREPSYDDDMSPEEREKIRIRRIRNKEAAARCRKRRVDQTNNLQDQVDDWQAKKQALEEEIHRLQQEREELTFWLNNHHNSPECKFVTGGDGSGNVSRVISYLPQQQQHQQQQHQLYAVKSQVHQHLQQQQQHVVAVKSEPVIVEPANAPYILPEQVILPESISAIKEEAAGQAAITTAAASFVISAPRPVTAVPVMMVNDEKPRRPMTLGLKPAVLAEMQQHPRSTTTVSKVVEGVAIDTPSSIVPSLSFDMLTSTGLTPTATPVSISAALALTTPTLNTPTMPSCGNQQRFKDSSSITELGSPEGISLVSL